MSAKNVIFLSIKLISDLQQTKNRMTSVFNITNIKLVFYKALIHSYFAPGLQYEIEVLKARISQEREKLRVYFFIYVYCTNNTEELYSLLYG